MMIDSTASHPEGRYLVVMMPALNEEATVGDVIRGVPREIDGVRRVDVVVIDDGSTDRTVDEARQAGAYVISHPNSQGVGAAFQTGLAAAMEMRADLVVNIDADGQFDPGTIPTLIRPVVADEADFATASRFADPQLIPEMSRIKRWGNYMMSRLISRLIRQRFHDVSCGMRCYNRRAAMSINAIGTFTYTQETFLNLAFKNLRMTEVPLPVRGRREHGASRVAGNLFRYGWNTLDIIFRCYRDYKPMRFFGRLAAALIVPGIALEAFLVVHYLRAGTFTPHKWAGFSGLGLCALGLVLLLMGILGDMLKRHRIYLEEVLYHVRSQRRRDPSPLRDDAQSSHPHKTVSPGPVEDARAR
jgi:glycosyltransferase involved in cell wall biosynthesis